MKARLPQGYGKQSPQDLMKQAQMMQEQMQKKQEELEAREFEASSGGGMVKITMQGNYQVSAVKIAPEAIDPEDVEMLEDMVAAAINDGVRLIAQATEDEMGSISGGLNIPGLGF